jgi:hypothetical protein
MPKVKKRPGSAIVTIVNGRPESSMAATSAAVVRPTGTSTASVVRHRNRNMARSINDATTTVPGMRIWKSRHERRFRSALRTAVPATAAAATAGCVSSTRRTSATSCCRTMPGVEGPVCSLISRENDAGDCGCTSRLPATG